MRALALLLLGWSACVAFDAIEIAVDISRAGPGNDAAPLEIRVERVREADARVIVDGAVAVPRGRASSMNMSLFGGEMGTARVLQTVVGSLRANFSFDLRDSALAAFPMALSIVVRADGPDGGPPLASATAFLDADEARAAASPPAVWGCAATAAPPTAGGRRRPPPPVEASVIIVDDGAAPHQERLEVARAPDGAGRCTACALGAFVERWSLGPVQALFVAGAAAATLSNHGDASVPERRVLVLSFEADDSEERLVSALNRALSMLPPADDSEDAAHAFQPGDRVVLVVGASAAAAAPPRALEEACATLGRHGVSLDVVSSLSHALDESATDSVVAVAPRAWTRRPDGYFSEYIRCALAHSGRLSGPFVMTTTDGKPPRAAHCASTV